MRRKKISNRKQKAKLLLGKQSAILHIVGSPEHELLHDRAKT